MIFFEEMFLKNYLNSSYELENNYYSDTFIKYVNLVPKNRVIYCEVIQNNNYLNKLISSNNNTNKYVDALIFDDNVTYFIFF